MIQCSQVYPVWVKLGLVKWACIAEPERQYCIEYLRCQQDATTVRHYRGSDFHVCLGHSK